MLIAFHHHLEARNKDPPGYDSSSELGKHARINILVVSHSFTLGLHVSFMEREWLLGSLGSSHRSLLVLLSSKRIILQDTLVKRLRCGPGDRVGLEHLATLTLLSLDTLLVLILKPSLSNSLRLSGVLHELIGDRHCDVVLTLASFENKVLLLDEGLLEAAFELDSFGLQVILFPPAREGNC